MRVMGDRAAIIVSGRQASGIAPRGGCRAGTKAAYRLLSGCLLLLACANAAWGAHPFITDDAKTQGKGNFELQLGAQLTRSTDNATTLSAFQFAPQLSYGLVDSVDLQIRPNYNVDFSTGADAQRESGFGDVFIGFKWRFFERGGWSSAIDVGTGLPTGNADRGLDAGRATPFAYLVGMWTHEALQLQATFGAIRNAALPEGRAWLAHVSAAALWKPRPGLQVGVDIITDQNPVRSSGQWPAAGLAGIIYSATSFLDLDLGYQHRLNHSAPDNQYLLGATFRW
jgi:Putative MetA-pathway of phenol degradation